MNHELDHPRGKQARLAIFGATVALAVLGSVPAAWSDSSTAAAKRSTKPLLKVTVRIRVIEGIWGARPVKLFFTPSVVNVGTVAIVARNSDHEYGHTVSINGVKSRWMGASGGTAVMKVTFKRPGTYIAATEVEEGETDGSGLLKVIK
jgi:hypothetical protein